MILKCLSSRNTQNLIKYIFKEKPGFYEPERVAKQVKYYIHGIKLTPQDIKHLESEKVDNQLLRELKAFKGSMQQFIAEKLLNKTPAAEKDKGQKPFVIKNNVRARTIEGYCREFSENESKRLYTRKDQVAAYHIIISWSPKDAKYLTDDILKSMATEFVRIRANDCLVVGTKHTEGVGHKHLHLAISGNRLNGMSSRISKSELFSIKKQLQDFQLQRYPFLSNSLPSHGKGKTNEKGAEKNIKNERLLDQQALQKCLDEVYATSSSKEHFLSQLKALGNKPYYRNGNFQGIMFNDRKWRIYRLGYDEHKLLALDMRKAIEEKTLKEMQALRKGGRTIGKDKTDTKEATNRELLYEETTDPKLQDKKRELQQDLVNTGKEFEKKNIVASETDGAPGEKSALQEIRSVRGKKELNKAQSSAVKDPGRYNKEETLQELQDIRDSNENDIDTNSGNTDNDRGSQSDRNEDDADNDTDDALEARNTSAMDDTDDSDDAQ